LNNIQLVVNNVHIRFEDQAHGRVAFGLLLSRLAVASTDANWNRR
jgi:hypothetical protein